MINRMEALRIRVEYALWSGRKAVHQPRLLSLQSRYILEQDDVNRLERGLFSKFKRGYEEKIEKEKTEAAEAKTEWERISALVKTAEEKLSVLEPKRKTYDAFWETASFSEWSGNEKEVLAWCKNAEEAKAVIEETNVCIELAKKAIGNTAMLEESPLPILQSRAEALHEKANALFANLHREERLPSWESMLYYLYSVQSFGGNYSAMPFGGNYGRNSIEDVQLAIATNTALFNLDQALKELRERLAEIFTEIEKEGERLLDQLHSGESHFCEREMKAQIAMEEEQRIVPEKSIFEGVGLFEQVDLSKEKERVLFGLDLLKKEFANITPDNELLPGWERALREWQQDLKQYRKHAGNFSCALDRYENLDKKIWQYTEEDGAELWKAYLEHLQDTAERLEKAEEQIRTHER